MSFALHKLPKTTTKSKKRVGRGYGSGKGGHTASRGQKGQNSRSGGSGKVFFEGTKSNKDFFRKTPMLRGKSKLKSHAKPSVLLKLTQLDVFKEGAVVNLKSLVANKLITERESQSKQIKVVFDKSIDKHLKFEIPASARVLSEVASKK